MKNIFYNLIQEEPKGLDRIVTRSILRGLSLIYRGVVNLRNGAFAAGVLRTHALSKPVISVGNLTVGGTGKTPFVSYLVHYLQTHKRASAVLTRGYKSAQTQEGQLSDEAQMLKEQCPQTPVLVGANRLKNAQDFLQTRSADVFILDDGFQHRQVKRDLDIVLIDSRHPFGYGELLPRGTLREPIESLNRADYLVMTKCDSPHQQKRMVYETLAKWNIHKPVIETIHEPVSLTDLGSSKELALTVLRNQSVCATSSIAAPEDFENTLKSLGAGIAKSFRFPDHYIYTQEDVAMIRDSCQKERVSNVVMTHKDAVKIKGFVDKNGQDIRYWVLNIRLKVIKNEHDLHQRIDSLFSR